MIMDCKEYLKWDLQSTKREYPEKTDKNVKYIQDNLSLMTIDELGDIIENVDEYLKKIEQ